MAAEDVEAKIIEALERADESRTTEEVAAAVELTRHTVSKYLQILHARGEVHLRRVGNAKLWSKPGEILRVVELSAEDVDRAIEIERDLRLARRNGGDGPPLAEHLAAFFETLTHHLELADTGRSICLKAEYRENGVVPGFIIGEVRMWEFGATEKTGWVELLAVDPDHQRQGVGNRLGQALVEAFAERGVRRIRTLVDAYSGELIAYFAGLGFEIVPMLSMERSLGD